MIELAVIGFGNRARKYVSCLEGRAHVAAIVDPSVECRSFASETFGIEASRCFEDFDAMLNSGLKVDAAIIASPDKTHYDYACRCIALGWPVMLEKPIATDPDECTVLAELSKRKGIDITVCYELRYHPYFMKLKELAGDPSLGKLLSVDWTVEVGLNRMMHSYVRGTWAREEESGPIALTKLCHDVDLLLWMLPGKPAGWHLEGGREFFRPDNAPAGAAARCIDCPIERECRFSAVDLYQRRREWIRNFIPLPGESIDDMISRILAETSYGRCVFHSDNNVNDAQTIAIDYPGGLKAMIRMQWERRGGNRSARFIYENGEIVADGTILKVFCGGALKKEYDFSDLVGLPLHAGADRELVLEFIDSVEKGRKTRSSIDDTLESHLICLNKHN